MGNNFAAQSQSPGMFDDLIPAKQQPPAAPETISSDEFSRRYGQPVAPAAQESLSQADFSAKYGNPAASQPSAPPQTAAASGGMFDDLIPQAPTQSTAAPDPAAAIAATRVPVVFGHGGASFSPRQQADAIVSGRDLGREVAQDASFNYSDEAIAGVRAALGENYAKALQNERDELKASEDRLGTGGRAAAAGISMLFPMGPVAKAVQRIAGPGAGLLKTAGASGLAMAPVGGFSAVGALNDKSDVGTDVNAFGTGAASAAVAAAALPAIGVPAYRLGKGVVEGAADLASRPIEFFRYRGENPNPLASTTNFAVRKIADASALGGMEKPSDVQNAINAFAVPNTPSALVNSGNDRFTAEALDAAANLKRPNVSRLVNGQRERTNLFETLQHTQSTNAQGQTQGDAFRDRLFSDADVPAWDRSLTNVLQDNQQQRDYRGLQLQDLETPTTGQAYNAGNVPGITRALSDPDFAQHYRDAARAISKPGSPDSIPANLIPALPQDVGSGGAAHVLADDNVPMPVLSLMRRNISAATQVEKSPAGQENARRMLALYDHLTGNGASGNVRDLNRLNSQLHDLHSDAEDLTAGYRIPTQTGLTRADAIAATRSLPGDRQDNVALGLVHGVADASKAQNENLGSLADDMFANPDFQQAFDSLVPARSPYAQPSADIRRELQNVGDMQGANSLLLATSKNRSVDTDTLPAQALSFYVRSHVAPHRHTFLADQIIGGRTQARTAEIARLLTDTHGEGVQRLTEELARRNAADYAARNNPAPLGRTILLNEIARQLAGAGQQGQ